MLNKIKGYLFIVLLFFLTGCGLKYNNNVNTIVYNLNISKSLRENIVFTFPSSSLSINSNDKGNYYFYKIIHDDLYPVSGDYNYKYGRKINKGKDKVEVVLNHNYLESEFSYSTYITQCFENYDMIIYKDYFEANLSGEFYCWKGQDVEINVSTDYVVDETNGEKIANDIMWYINKDNYKDVDIYYKVSRDYDKQLKKRNDKGMFNNIKYIIEIVIVIILLIVLYKFYKKKKKELDI